MSSEIFRHTHRVTYAECTLGNHIYHSRYLDLLEAARGEFVRHLGTTLTHWQDQGFIFPVTECHLCYRAPARYDDLLTIEVSLTLLQRVRLNFGHRIRNQNGQLILEGETHHACTTLGEKPVRLPDALHTLLAPYMRPSSVERPAG